MDRYFYVVTESSWTDPGVIVGVITAVLFLSVLVAQVLATRATSRSADAATKSAQASIDSANAAQQANTMAAAEMDIRLRATIGIGMPVLRPESIWPYRQIGYEIPVRNFGETPADNMDMLPKIGLNLALLWEEVGKQELRRRNGLFPNQIFDLSAEISLREYNDLKATESLYFATRVFYCDYHENYWVVESSYEMRIPHWYPVKIGVPIRISDLPSDHPASMQFYA